MALEELDQHLQALNIVAQKGRQYLNQQLKDLDLTASTYFFILKIGQRGELSQESLFKAIYLNPSNVTRRLTALIKLGDVIKEKSPLDARSRIVKLTPQGQRKYQVLLTRLPQIEQAVTASLSSAQLALLEQLLGSVETRLDELLAKEDDSNGESINR